MPQAWITDGLMLPDHADLYFVLLQLNPKKGTPVEAVIDQLYNFAYEGINTMHVPATSAWIERRRRGSTLTLDLVCYPHIIEKAEVDVGVFPERARRDPEAVRIVRTTCEVDPAQYAKAGKGTFLWTDKDGVTLKQIKRRIKAGEWPLSFDILLSVSARVTVLDPED